ncbi:Scr1 family TA system antitoxin-like transcriptional regulator [Amycolatopsis sp. DG1A-15b]|uniref:Scr1 family TA system antitoxin-like transcriptional regulator n=1 Tax=Amycolatopsis sp. DG1A-15b TaxID=3052846 RepID=UPI00255B79D7|nr:Scr1 family TA system antitoxin-like transcriptional regulator [Amycolatopsis sp. DG1A-15b]WIX85752.1 Scr1 family TA system antitoxin-like transcriptional regulator [Amycolatopsis sp. DG1A-15b]
MNTPKSLLALLALSGSLRAVRTDRGLGLRKFADKLGVSAQTLSNWETGRRAPAIEEVAHLLGFLRVSPVERQRVMRLWYQLDSPTFIETLSPDTTCLQQKLDELAFRAWEWAPHTVPEPLQTAEYARAILQRDQAPPDDVDVELFLRQARQLDRKQPRQRTVLLSEAALAPAPESQLHAINTMADRPQLRIMLVPVTDRVGRIEPFTIYETHGKGFTVAFRHHDNVIFVSERSLVQSYQSTFKTLEREAIDHVDRA